MLSRASLRQGAPAPRSIEREIVARHAQLGGKAERVPLSGAAHYRDNNARHRVYTFGPNAASLPIEPQLNRTAVRQARHDENI